MKVLKFVTRFNKQHGEHRQESVQCDQKCQKLSHVRAKTTRQFPPRCRGHNRSRSLSLPGTKRTLILAVQTRPHEQVTTAARTCQRMDRLHHLTL